MNIEEIKERYPDIELKELSADFPRMPISDYAELSEYSWEDCHKGVLGAGGLFLTSDMVRMIEAKEGMRILDLGAGNCLTSIFLAKRYKAKVIAADLRVNPSENWNRIKEAKVTDSVIPIKMDAYNIPFAKGYFDAVFCMNSYLYFGTGDLYLSYLVQFLRRGGRICIASPCYAHELSSETPSEFLEEASVAYHSPGWWQHHFEKTGLVNLLHCKEHPEGRELWLDMVRWLVEECHPRERDEGMGDMILHDILMLLNDRQRFVTYFMLLAEKK